MILQGILIKILRPRHVYSDKAVTDFEANPRTESLPSFISERAYPIAISLFFAWYTGLQFSKQGIELVPHALQAQSPNHWTTREVPAPSSCYKIILQKREDT